MTMLTKCLLPAGTHTARDALTDVPEGAIRPCTTHRTIDQYVTGAWVQYVDLAAILPTGGSTGQVLKKSSGADYDVTWGDDVTLTAEQVQDILGAAIVGAGDTTAVYDDGAGTVTITGAAGIDAEQVRDIIGAALGAGTNVSIVVDDPGDTITISASGGGSSRGPVSVAYAASVAPDVDTTATLNVGALTDNLTLANPTGTPTDGMNLRVRFAQDATGGRTVTFGTSYAFGTDVTTALIPSTASAKWEMLFTWHAGDSKWRASAIVRGF